MGCYKAFANAAATLSLGRLKGTINKRVRPKKLSILPFGKSQRSICPVRGVITLSVAEVALWLLIGLSNKK